MGWFGRKSRSGAPMDRAATREDVAHLKDFVRTRTGVEAYVEPRTMATETTIVLIAADGEWTRRRVAGPEAAAKLARTWDIPFYDAAVVGYPQRHARLDRAAPPRLSGPRGTADAAPERSGRCRGGRGQPPSARSVASWTRVRTATPVPPFGV